MGHTLYIVHPLISEMYADRTDKQCQKDMSHVLIVNISLWQMTTGPGPPNRLSRPYIQQRVTNTQAFASNTQAFGLEEVFD